MSLDIVGKLCCEFKILRRKSNLNINYSFSESLKHSSDLIKVCLDYEPNVDTIIKRIVFERPIFKDSKLQNYKWFLEPEYVPCKTTAGIIYIDFENVVEFVLTRQRDPLVRCNSMDNFSG